MDPDVTRGNGRGCPLVVHCWADLQSVHGFRCYDNIHVCRLIELYTANAYSVKREMSASFCTPCKAGLLIADDQSPCRGDALVVSALGVPNTPAEFSGAGFT